MHHRPAEAVQGLRLEPQMTPTPTYSYAGRRLLVVEDEYFIADDLAQDMKAKGAEVIGPASSIDDALRLIAENDQFDGAVVDINLKGKMAFPVADALIDRGIPFVFATGYDHTSIPPDYAHIPRFEKPIDMNKIARALLG